MLAELLFKGLNIKCNSSVNYSFTQHSCSELSMRIYILLLPHNVCTFRHWPGRLYHTAFNLPKVVLILQCFKKFYLYCISYLFTFISSSHHDAGSLHTGDILSKAYNTYQINILHSTTNDP